MTSEISVKGLPGIPEIQEGDDLFDLLATSMGTEVRPGDLFVITQKILSKAEGRVVHLSDVEPSRLALKLAERWGKDARFIELVLLESEEILRANRGILMCRTRHGFVCANAGIDRVNVGGDDVVCLLPKDPDGWARSLCEEFSGRFGFLIPVIVSDSFGRPFRQGVVNFAIGVAGMKPFADYRGFSDSFGRVTNSRMAVADELAAAAELVMGRLSGIPAARVRGFAWTPSNEGSAHMVRPANRELFQAQARLNAESL